jgi:hypothetical protein
MGCAQSTPEDLSSRYNNSGGVEVGGDITFLTNGYDSRKVMLKVILLGDSGYDTETTK